MSKTFLRAEWRKLAMANYSVDPKILEPYLPAHTEIDYWKGTCYVSLVGFMFLNTRLKGLSIPFHSSFEEVNLRFYVKYKDQLGWKRGVVFISEIVPRLALTLVANTLYGEHYQTLPMRHIWKKEESQMHTDYQWKSKRWNSFGIITSDTPVAMAKGSEEEFITEHFWGYTKLNSGRTSEYGVEHPRWEVYPTLQYEIDVDFEDVYGADFGFLNSAEPRSVFLAEGSEIKVMTGRKL